MRNPKFLDTARFSQAKEFGEGSRPTPPEVEPEGLLPHVPGPKHQFPGKMVDSDVDVSGSSLIMMGMGLHSIKSGAHSTLNPRFDSQGLNQKDGLWDQASRQPRGCHFPFCPNSVIFEPTQDQNSFEFEGTPKMMSNPHFPGVGSPFSSFQARRQVRENLGSLVAHSIQKQVVCTFREAMPFWRARFNCLLPSLLPVDQKWTRGTLWAPGGGDSPFDSRLVLLTQAPSQRGDLCFQPTPRAGPCLERARSFPFLRNPVL